MASIKGIIGDLESTKSKLAEAKTSADGARTDTEQMVNAAQAMDLEDVATELGELSSKIESAAAGVADLDQRLDDLIAMAEGIRTGPDAQGSGAGSQHQPQEQPRPQAAEASSPIETATPAVKNSWVSPDADQGTIGSGDKDVVLPQRSEPDVELRDSARKNPEAPSWRQKMLSTRTASIASATAGGAATTTASALGHLPLSVQAGVNSILAALSIWQVHKSNPKHEEKNDD